MSFLPLPSDAELSPAAQQAAEQHRREYAGELTLLDRHLLADASVFEAYRSWFALRDELVPYLGERAVDLFAHALSEAIGAPYCLAHFRRVLEANGDDPAEPQVTDAEGLLIEWARAIGAAPSAIPVELRERVEQTFQPRLRLLLTAFAGLMTAVAVFTLAGGIEAEPAAG